MSELISDSALPHDSVEIIVSDNCSADATPAILSEFDGGPFRYRWHRQQTNLGLDANVRFLYKQSSGEYVWCFADDDILYPNAIDQVVSALRTYSPDALLFSFVQPPGTSFRTFDFPNSVTVVEDPGKIIDLLAQYPKLSIYVYRRIPFTADDWSQLSDSLGSNFDFVSLGFTLMQKARQPRLCVISEPLAGCDEDFSVVRFSPETWGKAWEVFRHPFVRKVSPYLEVTKRRESYYAQIQMLVAVKAGKILVSDIDSYDRFIRDLDVRWASLLRNPKAMVQLVLLKFGLIPWWMRY
jgi:glycosyltransferase involved in cell wall biosynthesis